MFKRSSKSSLFLMELIMSILFFSLAAAVCVQLFVTSHTLSKSSVELNHAVVECESLAEYLQGTNGSLGKSESITMFFDKDFNKQSSESEDELTCYILSCKEISDSSDDNMLQYEISFIRTGDNKLIYSISPAYYRKGGSF